MGETNPTPEQDLTVTGVSDAEPGTDLPPVSDVTPAPAPAPASPDPARPVRAPGEHLAAPTTPTVPTQVGRPWQATARSVFQAVVAFAVLFPLLVAATGLQPTQYPWMAVPVAVFAALTRVMAIPQVDQFLAQFLPFLAADPKGPRR